jgi:hypothetical protein
MVLAEPYNMKNYVNIYFQTYQGRFIRADEGSGIDTQAYVGEWEKFTIEPCQSSVLPPPPNVYHIRTHSSKYIRAHYGKYSLVDQTATVDDMWSRFTFVRLNDGNDTFAIETIHGTLLRAIDNGYIDTQNATGPWEKFKIGIA